MPLRTYDIVTILVAVKVSKIYVGFCCRYPAGELSYGKSFALHLRLHPTYHYFRKYQLSSATSWFSSSVSFVNKSSTVIRKKRCLST